MYRYVVVGSSFALQTTCLSAMRTMRQYHIEEVLITMLFAHAGL